MTPRRLILTALILAGLAGTAFWAREAEGPGLRMTGTAEKLVASLKPEQKSKGVFDFDSKERTRWYFTPQQKDRKPTRKGLRLDEMSKEQRELTLALVKEGLSDKGYKEATTITSLESILAELEKKGTNVRNPEWYFLSVFGSPSKTSKWGWRFEGHHLSLNFTLEGGKILSATPTFFGANPAEVKSGPRKGLRTLPGSVDKLRALVDLLDEDQRKAAHQSKPFPEIEEAVARPGVGKPVGIPGSKLNDKQKAALMALIETYADRVTDDVSRRQLAQVKKDGLAEVHFAYGPGDGTPGKPFTYRVQGPAFVIEFLDVQSDSAGNPANHIHSAWRNMKGDFGLAP